MTVYDKNRGRPGTRPNLWISFMLTPELAARFGVPRRVREPAHTGDKRTAAKLDAQRAREVAAGTWRPRDSQTGRTTLAAYAETWLAKRARRGYVAAKAEAQRVRYYLVPALGHIALEDVSRRHVVDFVDGLKDHVSERTGRKLAPRTIRLVYAITKVMLDDAAADGLILASPATLKQRRDELPERADASPRWRRTAIFARDEVERLISDERIPEQRRVLYALVFLGGLRISEATARQWRDLDAQAEPLGRLLVETQADDEADDNERETKTGAVREVPVHPVLARILARWRLRTYEILYGWKPEGERLIVPNLARGTTPPGGPIDRRNAYTNLQRDLVRIGLRRRRTHDLRRTFITLVLADGASDYLTRWITHTPPERSAFDTYNSPPWEALCAQVAKLRIEERGRAPVAELDAPRTKARRSAGGVLRVTSLVTRPESARAWERNNTPFRR